MRRPALALAVILTIAVGGRPVVAQDLGFGLFERYLDSLREQAGIPGLSAVIVQNGSVAWERGLGRINVDANVAPSPGTPYPIGDLSQVFGATVLLRKCVDQSYLEVTDPIVRWLPAYASSRTTVAHLLAHATDDGGYRYDPSRFADLGDVVRQCAHDAYPRLLNEEIFERLGMSDSVPGATITRSDANASLFSGDDLQRYDGVLQRMAVSYRVDSRGRATRSDFAPRPLDASQGIVTSARDLARFDLALSSGALLDRTTLAAAWTRASTAGGALPTGLGWFVQSYNGEPLVWQFGAIKDAYSSLLLKLPNRNLTLILLANSDGLTSSAALERGDVTASAFVRTLLRLLAI